MKYFKKFLFSLILLSIPIVGGLWVYPLTLYAYNSSTGQNTLYWGRSLTGGGAGAMDAIDGNSIAAGDSFILVSTTGHILSVYQVIEDSATDNGLSVVAPDTNPGTKRWHFVSMSFDIGSDPAIKFYDIDAPGSTQAEKSMAQIHGAFASGLDNHEYGTMTAQVMVDGTMTTVGTFSSTGLTLGPGMGYNLTKSSGVAGTIRAYEANSTDTNTIGWMGPANISASWDYQFNSTAPSAGSLMVFGAPSSNISAQTWVTIDDSGTNGDTAKILTADGTYDMITSRIAAFGSGDVTGGSASAAGELAAYTDTGGKAITRSYLKFGGLNTTVRTMTVPDADFTVASLGGANTFTGTNTIGDGGDDIREVLNVNASDGTWSGVAIVRTVDSGAAASSFGQAYHVDSDGELIAADADAATTAPCTALAITTGTGATKTILLRGIITETDWNWTPGGEIYLSTDPSTTCGLTQTAPSGSGDQVQVLGIALSADTIYFNPDLTLVEVK